jgi:deoxyribodipyrimidine photo-lyase
MVSEQRIRAANQEQLREDGDYVLYWMTAARRLTWNFGLQRAVEHCRALGKPLLVLEALRVGYPWASDRFHTFVLQGMADHAKAAITAPLSYHPYVETEAGNGRGLLKELAGHACVVVTDDYPAFFYPRMLRAAARIPVSLEAIDCNGILPMRAAERVFKTAHSFRRFLQSRLLDHLAEPPLPDPLSGVSLPRLDKMPGNILERWPATPVEELEQPHELLRELSIDHGVAPVDYRGGNVAAEQRLARFVEDKLSAYAEQRNRLDEEATSGLSPYLHFGHISSHQVVDRVLQREDWQAKQVSSDTSGKRRGWWGLSESAEGFLDQIITWRELGFNMCWQRDDYEDFDSLPPWALKTLGDHADDQRPYLYSKNELESAATHDPLWNAAQVQLQREGRIHNYMRMLWGKKILEWSESPLVALEVMLDLNNKYAVDGRDPNSTSGIFWVLGRYDRAWGPERPIFGKVRYMSSENTARKLKTDEYLDRYAN